MKPTKTELDLYHFQDMFFHIRNTTRIFDEIQFNYNCARRDVKHFYPKDESEINSDFHYHALKVMQLLEYWEIVDKDYHKKERIASFYEKYANRVDD
jgi:hypothetical protein